MHRRNCMGAGLGAGLGVGVRTALPPFTLALAGCAAKPAAVAFAGATMGTRYQVQIAASIGDTERAALQGEVDSVLAGIDRAMSTYKAQSEVSRLNAAAAGEWLTVSPATRTVLARALEVWSRSEGAFDISVGPLVDLWGFGQRGPRDDVPGESALAAAHAQVGLAGLELSRDAPAVRKSGGHIRLDLSAIAKGYALDRVTAHLDTRGFDAYLVDVGGELRARGSRADGAPWRIAIEQPLAGRRAVQRVVELGERAIASSGDYRNFFEHGGVRYSHTIDPRTGWPVRHALAAVSVIAADAMTADAEATAILVLGAGAGLEFATRHGIAAHLSVRTDSGLREHVSPAMRPHLAA